jgi:hypothetical protein
MVRQVPHQQNKSEIRRPVKRSTSQRPTPSSFLSASMSKQQEGAQPDHLIIVCCHGIWVPNLYEAEPETFDVSQVGDPMNELLENKWLIEPFQAGETTTFIQHILAGIEALGADQNAVLVLSG